MEYLLKLFSVAAMVCLPFTGVVNGIAQDAVEQKITIEQNRNKQKNMENLVHQLIVKYGESQRARIEQGIKQVSALWREEDGTQQELETFVLTYFAGTQEAKDELFAQFSKQLEKISGHHNLIQLSLREKVDLDLGPIEPIDQLFAGYDSSSHLADDFFKNKLAFVVLLNFPVTTLEERVTEGGKWTRREWAEARLASYYTKRVPAEVLQKIAQAFADAEAYVGDYKFYMHHVLTAKGERPFQSGLKLLSHWDLRDEIRGLYSDRADDPAHVLMKQRMIQRIMEKVILQEVPAAVINNPNLDWNLDSNEVTVSLVKDGDHPEKVGIEASNAPEPNSRYATLLNVFRACRLEDPYSPAEPTYIDREFNESKEIPEKRFRAILEEVLTAPELTEIAELISSRVDRPLEPFDLWYTGFQARGDYSEAFLDKLCREKYPTAKAFEVDIPNILMKLGFPEEKAKYIGSHVSVDPVRGSGHAWGAAMRFENAHLRTDVQAGGMEYKGFNTAMHELGHCTEQTISLHWIDEYFLHGVPNNAFTEAMAFVYQAKDMEMLGLKEPDKEALAYKAINDLWMAYEIAGVAMVDIDLWHWMYEHPEATPAQMRDATVQIAKDYWNRYYAPVFGCKDSPILAIYSHILHCGIYLPDYPMGHIIASQIEHYIEKSGKVGPEIERMAKIGCIVPDLWMQQATGSPVTAKPMIKAAAVALKQVK